jgi:alginate O-acetyltransferase complex protein AlgI
MTILQLGIFALAAVAIGWLERGRELTLLGMSVFVVYWLQPPQEFVSLAFWLPTATLGLTSFVWLLVTTPEARSWKQNWSAWLVIAGVVLLVDLNQFFGFEKIYMTATPSLWMMVMVAVFYSTFLLAMLKYSRARGFLLATIFVVIILLFIFLKTPFLMTKSFDLVYDLQGQPAQDSRYIFFWLGYSYVAFRLLHTIRDHQNGRLPTMTLSEYVNYAVFFPAFAAGPIDRAERFVQELRTPIPLAGPDWVDAGTRFFMGLFKKFVIADALFLISINDVLAGQVGSAGWMWFFLYMYSLRIYFDFSGYTDIAIGLARVLGIRLPENFATPYLKPNITQFWNSWHITLAEWFRTYFFNPLTRAVRTRDLPAPLVIFIAQVSTMILIGLWHGVTWSFVLWGLWHGLGLYAHNRWSELIRLRIRNPFPARSQLFLNGIGVFLTFNFVSLGWLFFTLSTPAVAWNALMKLFGVAL